MTQPRFIMALVMLSAAWPLAAGAQSREAEREVERERNRMRSFSFSRDDDRPRLGVSISTGSRRDTLGLLVTSVTEDSPADKAGIEEGDRIAAINGVNLRVSREDLEDPETEGIAYRRLVRELGKLKAGDRATLRVWSNGSVKEVTVTLEEPEKFEAVARSRDDREDRAALGIGLGSGGSKRDTLGVLITSLVEDGPAEKAGIVEGDRLVSVNGVDLRVPREDAGDWSMSSSRIRRLNRELEKVKPGEDVELRVYSSGQTKTLRVKTEKASELSEGFSYFFGNGVTPAPLRGMLRGPQTIVVPRPPRVRIERGPATIRELEEGGDIRIELDEHFRGELERGVENFRRGLLHLRDLKPVIRVGVI